MAQHTQSRDPSLSVPELLLIDQICDRFQSACGGQGPRLEEFLSSAPPALTARLFAELLALEVELRRNRGEAPTAAEYVGRFPQYAAAVHAELPPAPRASRPEAGWGHLQIGEELGRGLFLFVS